MVTEHIDYMYIDGFESLVDFEENFFDMLNRHKDKIPLEFTGTIVITIEYMEEEDENN